MEHRTMKGAVREVDADGVPGVTLRAIAPGVVDDYGSLWNPRSLDAEMAERMPTLVWAHDWTEPLGPAVSYEAGDDGPAVRFNFSDFDAVPMAKRAHAQLQDGTIQDCSVGFTYLEKRDPTKEERDAHPGIREVIERARCDEISLVLRGAVPGAKVLAVRSAHLRSGALVDLEAVYQIAEDIAAGKITPEQGKASVELLAERVDEAPPTPAAEPEKTEEQIAEEEAVAAQAALIAANAEAEMIAAESIATEALAE